jgi:hypothetical protein
MQTGLKDPLSRFSRHELEQFFERFRSNLDTHLRRLLGEARKEDPAGVEQLVAAASPSARQALRRADSMR